MNWNDEQAETAAREMIFRFYPDDTPLREMLLKHSYQVLGKAREILDRTGLPLDRGVVTAGSLLHDIGISKCHAPDIFCFGAEPYIAHGIIGAAELRSCGAWDAPTREILARICERHTGTGLTAADIHRQHLPLPERDYLPETPEEKLICLADKFFSKSGRMAEKTPEKIVRAMEKFGPESIRRWQELCREFNLV